MAGGKVGRPRAYSDNPQSPQRRVSLVTEEQAEELRRLRTSCLLQASDGDAISGYLRLKGTAAEILRKAEAGEPGYTTELSELYRAAAEGLRERFRHQFNMEQIPR